ncbi:pilus assembly protein PilM [Candidatus Nomurabacteria bacterium]|nr:pilus assembly protein PilM [Candidatus Nomurabacteria bacterium]
MLNFINHFTEEQVIGLNISDFSAEAVILEKKNKGWKVLSFARYRLSPGVVEDGNILQAEKLKEDLKKLFALGKPQEMKASSVFLSIPDSKVFIRVLSLPKTLRQKDLINAALGKAEEFVPEDTDNLSPVTKVLSVINGQAQVLYAAAKKSLVKEWADLFESMNIDIIGMTVESVSSFAGLAEGLKKEDTLLLDLGARTTIASIFDQEGIKDSIVVPIAGNNITDAIVQKLNISHTAAEEKKRKIGMDASVDQGEIMWIIQGQMQPIADELKRLIAFHEESTGKKLKNLILIGGTAQIKGIEKYFGDNLGLKVIPVETIVEHKQAKHFEYFQDSKYINALGLAKLAYDKKTEINFYQTIRVDLQQRVDWQNLSLWLKAIKMFFKKGAKFLVSRLGIFIIVLVIISGVVIWKYDSIINLVSPPQKIFNQEVIVAKQNQGWNNFIQGAELKESVFVKQDLPGLPYQAAVNLIRLEGEKLALERVKSKIKSTQYLLEKPINLEVISLFPSEEDFVIGDILSMRANYVFLEIDQQLVKKYILSNLSAKEIEKYSTWQIVSQNFSFTPSIGQEPYFVVQSQLELRKP